MNKKKFVVLALLLVAVIALTSCMLVACNDDNSTDNSTPTATIEATKDLLINNGDFKVVDTTVNTYPRSITSWTGSKMYSSGDFRDDVIAGAISLEKALYDANKSSWNDDNDELYNKLTAGGKYGDDDKIKNALLVYMPEESTNDEGEKIHGATAYGYTSTSFTLDKGSYYKLSVDVLTHNIGGANEQDRGARIYVSSNTYAEFDGIDTKGEWKTFEIYFESSPASSTSLSVLLGLGKYSNSFQTGLTTGYAVFDNLTLEKIEDDDATPQIEGRAAFESAKASELTNNAYIQTATLKVPNGRFDFGSTTLSSSGTPNNWTLMTGNRGEEDPAPTSLGYNAIIDTSKFADNYKKYSSTFYVKQKSDSGKDNVVSFVPAENLGNIISSIQDYSGRVGTNVFMLSQQLMTAQGIRSSRSITIEKNKTYAISIDVFTYGIHGAGVSLILSGSDGKDIVIKGISSNKSESVFIGNHSIDTSDNSYDLGQVEGLSTNAWTTYTFYIKGNQFADYNYNMAVWLGTDGTNDNTSVSYTAKSTSTTYDANGTFSNGWVFVDELTLSEITELPTDDSVAPANDDQTLDCSKEGYKNKTGLVVDLTTENLFGEGDEYMLNKTTDTPTLEGVKVTSLGVPQGFISNFDKTDSKNPIITDIITEGVVDLSSEGAFNGIGAYPQLPYDIVSKKAYMIHASSQSYYEVETDQIKVKAGSFVRISFWVKTVDVASTSGAYVYVINKDDEDATLTSITKINTKDFDEYTNDWCAVTVVIRATETEDTNIALKFTLGTGSRWDAATLTSGAMYVTNLSMTNISYANYSDTTTGTYVKSVDLSSSNSYTFANGSFDTYDYDDDNLESGTPLNAQSVAGKPNDWTFSDNTLNPNKADSQLVAGVIALNTEDNLTFSHSAQTDAIFGSTIDFDHFYPAITDTNDYEVYPGEKAQLLAIGSKDDTKFAAGFSSGNFSLSANSFYKLSVYVKTVNAGKVSIFLTGDSSSSIDNKSFLIENSTADWTKYTFFIRVGQTSVSLKLNLWLGQDVEYDSTVEGETDDEKKENAKSSGVVFFDNVIYNTITEEDFNKAEASDTTNVISFTTDTFDAISSTIESRTTLSSPKGWSGSVGTAQLSSNTKAGVIYADKNFFDTEMVGEGDDAVEYAKILGKDYKVEDVTITDEEFNTAKADAKYEGMSDDEITAALKEEKVLNLKKENWIPVDELKPNSGKRMLIINNTAKSAYTYTSSSITMKENKFYQVTLYMRTYGLSDGEKEGANIEVYLGSANETDKPFIFEAQKQDEWTKYTFLVKTLEEDVTSVTVKLSLGSYHAETVDGETKVTGTTSGYAMFDDVTIEEITEDAFEQAVENDDKSKGDLLKKRTVISEKSGSQTEEPTQTTPENKFNVESLAWMIPTIILGVLIIAVLIVFVIRKIKEKQPASHKKKVAKTTTPDATKTLDTKRDKYDENKE